MEAGAAKAAIRSAVVEAMGVTDIPEISVTRICSAAGVSRTTFYRHYGSVDDVVKEIGKELLDKVEAASKNDRFDPQRAQQRFEVRPSDLARAQALHDYAPFVAAVTSIHGDPAFKYKSRALIKRWVREYYSLQDDKSLKAEFSAEFMSAGMGHIIDWWLTKHPDIAPEDFFALQQEAYGFLAHLMRQEPR